MDELQAFYDAAFPRLEDAAAYLEQLPSTRFPTTPPGSSSSATR